MTGRQELRAEIDRFIFDRFGCCANSADLDNLMALFEARVAAIEAERDRFREHSVQLNAIGWKLAEAVGDVGAGDTEVGGDRQERLARLVAERDDLRVKADTYQRMYYAEHGETAAELTALQQRVAELTAELDRAYSQRNDVLDSLAAERTQAAAQAWDEGWYACWADKSNDVRKATPNPYRETPAGFSANCLVINGVCIAEHDCGAEPPGEITPHPFHLSSDVGEVPRCWRCPRSPEDPIHFFGGVKP